MFGKVTAVLGATDSIVFALFAGHGLAVFGRNTSKGIERHATQSQGIAYHAH